MIDHDALTDRELAWSQTEFPEIPTRFEADPYHEDGACFSMRLNLIDPPKEPPWRRFRVSQVLIGLCATVAMTAIGGVAITLTAIEQRHTPTKAPTAPSVAPPTSLPAAVLPTGAPPTAVPPARSNRARCRRRPRCPVLRRRPEWRRRSHPRRHRRPRPSR